MTADPARTTRLLLALLRDGDASVSDELLPLLYDELRALARRIMGSERRDHTLQPTALIHEAWLRLVDSSAAEAADSRAHFLRLAATAMRRVLVDHARAHRAHKRGGADVGRHRMTLHEDAVGGGMVDSAEVVAVDDALCALAKVDEQLAQIVELRVFGGLTNPEVADAMGTSPRSVERGWRLARAWLLKEMGAARRLAETAMARRSAQEECPHCGALFRAGRLACPECGSDARTGWKDADEIDYQSIEIPDGWGPDDGKRQVIGRRWLWWVLALLALASMTAWSLLAR